MPQDQLYKQYADIPALEDQTTKILTMFDQVEKGMEKLNSFGLKINTSGSAAGVEGLGKEFDELGETIKKQQKEIATLAVKLAGLTTEEAKQAEALKQVISLTKGLTAEEIKNQKIRQGEYETLQRAKQANKELAASIQLRLRIRNAEEGSIEQLNLKYQKLTGIITRLSEEQRKTARGQELIKQAEALRSKTNELNKSMGNFTQNVGRYAESLSGLFDRVTQEISTLKTRQADLIAQQKANPIGFQLSGGENELKKTEAALGELEGVMASANKEGQSFNKTVRQIGFAFSNMSEAGNQSDDFIRDFGVAAAEAKDKSDDLRDEIKALASDTRQLDLAVGTISFMASAFEAGAGAAALFGTSTEDVERVTQKLIAIQSIANGVREVGEQITKRGTAANKAYNIVLKQGEILFGKGSTAAQRFAVALKAIAVVAVITFLIQLIQYLSLTEDKAEDVTKEIEKLNKALERNREIIAGLNKGDEFDFKKNIEAIKKASLERLKVAKTEGEKLKIENETKRQIYNAEVDFKRKQIEQIRDEVDNAQNDEAREAQKQAEFLRALEARGVKTISKDRREAMREKLRILEEETAKRKEALTDAQRDLILFQRQGENDLTEEELKQADERRKKALEASEAEKKAALELFKFRQGLIIEQKQFEASEDSFGSANFKVLAAKQAAAAEQKVLDAQLAYDLSQRNLANSERIRLDEEYVQNKKNLENKLSTDIILIYTREKNERIRLAQEASDDFDAAQEAIAADRADRAQKAFDKEQQQLTTFRDEDLRNNAENFEAGLQTYDEYAKKKEKIEQDYQRRILESQIRFYKQQRDLLKANGEDTTAIDAAIAEAEAALATNRIGIAKDVADKNKEYAEQTKQNYLNAFQQIGEAFTGVFSAMAEARKQQLQEEMDAIDIRKEKEIEAVNASTDSAEKKAARIKVIEARAQSDKDARERKQRAIDRQNAILERSFKAFQVTTDTIMGVNKIRLLIAAAPDPITKALYSSQLVLAIASGAASLAAIFAAPLPKYARGGTVDRDTFAEVAEEGPELAVNRSGKLQMYQKRQVAYLTKGTKVYPANLTRDIIDAASNDLRVGSVNWSTNEHGEIDYSIQEDMLYELRQFNRRPPTSINVSENLEVTEYYQNQIKR